MPVYFDCTDKQAFSDLRQKYAVSGYPSVVFIDPEGRKLKEVVGAKDLGEFTAAIDTVAKKFPGRPSFWNNTLKGATDAARAGKKKIALYVAKEDADPVKVTLALNKHLGDRKTKLAWTWETGTPKVLEQRGLEKTPAVVLFSVGDKDGSLTLIGKVTVKEGDDPKLVNDAIDEILKSARK